MAEANSKHLYPNSDLKGNSIPFDVLLSYASCFVNFGAAADDNITLPDEGELIVLHGDPNYDCWIKLATSIVAPTEKVFVTNLIFVPAGSIKVIDRNGAAAISVIGVTADAGMLVIEMAYSYNDANKNTQINRP